MIDIIFPVSIENIDIARESLEAIEENTDVPFRILAVVDGGGDESAALEAQLRGSDYGSWMHHNDVHRYLNRCILQALDHVKGEFVALIPPEVRIDDPQWFGKMQQVFLKDPLAFVVDGCSNTSSVALPPIRRTVHDHPSERFAMLRRRALLSMGVSLKREPVVHWHDSAIKKGGTSWMTPGVRYMIVDHKEHLTWRESLADQTRSEWPSQMTLD